MNKELDTFDAAKYLDSKEIIAEYLSQILEDGDMDEHAFCHWRYRKSQRHDRHSQ